jgi:hypothetical protein
LVISTKNEPRPDYASVILAAKFGFIPNLAKIAGGRAAIGALEDAASRVAGASGTQVKSAD